MRAVIDVTKPWKNKQFFKVSKISDEPTMSSKPPWDEPNFDKVPEPERIKRSPKRT